MNKNETKEHLYTTGQELMTRFLEINKLRPPTLKRLLKTDRLYELATCAYYRPETISIMVEKCATIGRAAQAWSCPGWKIDRTPHGVLQHELGHHVDHLMTQFYGGVHFAYTCYTGEQPLTKYLGTDNSDRTFYSEWFAEHFRLFVTNPQLSKLIAPGWFARVSKYFLPTTQQDALTVLQQNGAPERTILQYHKLKGV